MVRYAFMAVLYRGRPDPASGKLKPGRSFIELQPGPGPQPVGQAGPRRLWPWL